MLTRADVRLPALESAHPGSSRAELTSNAIARLSQQSPGRWSLSVGVSSRCAEGVALPAAATGRQQRAQLPLDECPQKFAQILPVATPLSFKGAAGQIAQWEPESRR